MLELENTPFNDLVFPDESIIEYANKTISITKWNWIYEDFLIFQKQVQKVIQNNRKYKAYLFCNHPHCFTLGRGNERNQDQLIGFESNDEEKLDFPVHRIHRGGGISFHHPGQWVFYPIIAVNEKYNLETHMSWLLNSVKVTLQNKPYEIQVMATNKLMGVWHERKKIASIGVGLNKFVTEHGIAVNLSYDDKMLAELKKINPCGISSETYTCVVNTVSCLVETPDLVKNFDRLYRLNHQI